MEENKEGTQQAAQEAYVRQLAELSARVLHMTEEQKQRNAAKIEELNKRVAALPPALRGLYAQKLRSLAPEAPAPQAAPVQQPPAADAAYEPEYADGYEYEEEDEDEVPARRRKKRKKHGCLIVMLVFLMLAALAAAAGWFLLSGEVSGSRGAAVTQSVTIEKGSGPLAIGQKLQDAGIIRSAQVFRFYVRGKDGAADTLQYGTFELSSDMSYDEIIAALQVATDDRETVRVTFPEGKTVIQYAQIMEQAGLCSAQEFLDVANNGDFSQFGFWAKREEKPNQFMKAEGYLFPDTYEFFVGDTVYNMVAKIYGEFDNKITAEMYARMDELDMTLTEVVTLASLVQEEAGNEYSKMVSAVFHNRLASGMTLGSNVAWDKEKADDNNYIYDSMAGPYGYGSWDAIPAELREAYDTYTHTGLPAGPVSNPGLLSIEAALWPEENCDYLYFQTDTLGNYHFAKTNAEHEAITADLESQGIRP